MFFLFLLLFCFFVFCLSIQSTYAELEGKTLSPRPKNTRSALCRHAAFELSEINGQHRLLSGGRDCEAVAEADAETETEAATGTETETEAHAHRRRAQET